MQSRIILGTMIPSRKVLTRIVLLVAFVCIWLPGSPPRAQQRANSVFEPTAKNPLYESGRGPLILIDEGHDNFHTRSGRYKPFAQVLEADGYQVAAHSGQVTAESLSASGVLVISNALHKQNVGNWVLPTPSAFTPEEIGTILRFVESGGGLLLIADHMPFPGAAAELAAEFGVTLKNGFAFALDTSGQQISPAVFRRPELQNNGRSQGLIVDHPITRGRNESENINQVASFTGCAFRLKGNAKSLLDFKGNTVMYLPRVAWEFDDGINAIEVAGWSQAAAIEQGKGRVVIFGEAAMLTSQIGGNGTDLGFKATEARDNEQMLLNVLHWLSLAL